MKVKNKKNIQDFGEFIPGSFKHHGALSLEAFEKMTEAEQRLKAKREIIWPVIDAESLVNKGADVFTTYIQTKIRKMVLAIPATKDDNFMDVAKRYVKSLNDFKSVVMNLKSEDEIKDFLDDVYNHSEWADCVSVYRVRALKWNLRHLRYKCESEDFPTKKPRKTSERKKSFKLAPLASIERGGEDYRKGRNSSEKKWEDTFNFRGVVFGASVPQKERQDDLNCGEDGFRDLAVALDMANSDVSLNGTLSVSFAARGRGHAGGHYEVLHQIMNLTRTSGAGTVAKLWFYAFDDALAKYVGITSGHLASEATDAEKDLLPSSFCRLIDSLKYDVDKNETNFYKGSKGFDKHFKKNSYGAWGSNAEMASRAFACYVKDNLGVKSDYIVAHADSYEFTYENQCLCAIPQGEERELLNEMFDKIFYDMKKIGFFHERPIEIKSEKKKNKTSTKKSLNPNDKIIQLNIAEDSKGQMQFVF